MEGSKALLQSGAPGGGLVRPEGMDLDGIEVPTKDTTGGSKLTSWIGLFAARKDRRGSIGFNADISPIARYKCELH